LPYRITHSTKVGDNSFRTIMTRWTRSSRRSVATAARAASMSGYCAHAAGSWQAVPRLTVVISLNMVLPASVKGGAPRVCAVLHMFRCGRRSDLEADASKRGEQFVLDDGKNSCSGRRTAQKPPHRSLGTGRMQHSHAAEQALDGWLDCRASCKRAVKLVQRSADVAFCVAYRELADGRDDRVDRRFDRSEIRGVRYVTHVSLTPIGRRLSRESRL
jgi:hypothetical protein